MGMSPFFFAIKLLMLLLFALPYLQPATSMAHNNFTDLDSLLAFKAHVTDPRGILNSNWTINTSFCSWIGVRCSHQHQRVAGLNLSSFALEGTISPHLTNLSFLSDLDLYNNSLTGPIPDSLTRLPRLEQLILENNHLFGPLPSRIFNMSSLISIDFGSNNLTGSLPSNHSLTLLPRLQFFSVENNQLTGQIPSSFVQCPNLWTLILRENEFTGTIPAELGNLSQLKGLYLGKNYLTGTIPTSLCNLTMLKQLALGWNNLNGELPKEMGKLLNLQYLNLAVNRLTGAIPSTLFNASTLNAVELTDNSLTGSVPVTIGKSTPQVTCIHLGFNQLTGGLDFITSLSNCRYLESFRIGNNELTGVLPDSIGNLSLYLENFDASTNHIQGKIPATFGNLSGLLSLNLGINELTGSIPTQLTGSIPTQLTGMKKLQEMHLATNQISGLIPSEIGGMTSLGTLALQENALSGEIPGSLANITSLQKINLSTNKLSSNIPQVLWKLTGFIDLSLANNFLDGSLPPEVGDLKALSKLDLSNNQLSGNITSALGELTMLTYLDLSSNSFSGQIPPSLGELVNIEHLNLSHNSLLGAIPTSLANPRYLSSLDLSYNKLEGKIPEGRVFSNLSSSSLVGNGALCGAPQLSFPPCPENARRKKNLLKYILPAIGSLVVLLVCLILLLKFCWTPVKKNPVRRDYTQCLKEYRMVSYHELIGATDNFSEANLLGRGSFGSVFKACLNDGMLAAIKVLNLDVEGASKSFESECHALSMLRHRNLVKIINICSNMDFKALVLQFMSNGSLENWLYSDTHYLDLLQRINIMTDVSSALEYLHHHHSHVVVHCDIKPSNVLLDENMIAHVGDFGIAKLFLGDSGMAISTSALGTIGYMAPEYGSMGKVSRKGDVYSFGILLLETFTRKKPTDAMFNGELSLRQWVENAYPTRVLEIVDDNLLRDNSDGMKSDDLTRIHKCLSSIIDLGLLCSKDFPNERMLMKHVVPRLQKIKEECFSKFLSI